MSLLVRRASASPDEAAYSWVVADSVGDADPGTPVRGFSGSLAWLRAWFYWLRTYRSS